MARRSHMSMQKRQREIRRAEKAAQKRAKRHGLIPEGAAEPRPTAGAAELFGREPAEEQTATHRQEDDGAGDTEES